MAFGKQIFYQDFHSAGSGNNRYFAEDINEIIMGSQGNQVVSGCDVTVDTETDLTASGDHLDVAAGVSFNNGAKRTISNTKIDLSTAFNAMSAGQARFILIYINSSGVVSTSSGDITTDGNQLPEVSSTGWTPVDTTPLAWIYLRTSDSILDANQINNQIIYAPNGGYFSGDVYVTGSTKNQADNEGFFAGAGDDLRMYHDGTDSWLTNTSTITNGRLVIFQSGSGNGQHIHLQNNSGDGNIQANLRNKFLIIDQDDSNLTLFDLDTSNRTLELSAASGTAMKMGVGVTPTSLLHLKNAGGDPNVTHSTTIANAASQIAKTGTGTTLTSGISTDSTFGWLQAQHTDNTLKNIVFNLLGGDVGFGIIPTQNLHLPDNAIIGLGSASGGDMQIFHDTTDSWISIISATGTRNLYLDNADSGHIYARTRGSFRVLDRDDSDAILFDVSAGSNLAIFNVALTVNQDIVINHDGGTGLIIDANTSGTPSNVIQFRDQGGNTGFIGHSSSGNDDFVIKNETTGSLILATASAASAITISTAGLVTLSNNLLVDGGDIGITADTDLLQLASGALIINGTATLTGLLSTSAIRPTSSDSVNLGGASNRWNAFWMNDTPTVSGTAVEIDAAGQVAKSSSSKRYKENFGNFELDTSIIYQFPEPETFNLISNKKINLFGYMAEDISEILPEVINYDIKGRPDSIDYRARMTVIIIEEMKKLNQRIKVLENN
ncbi:MAG: hypothetical protein V3V19_11250 [Cocleimonas sp.]